MFLWYTSGLSAGTLALCTCLDAILGIVTRMLMLSAKAIISSNRAWNSDSHFFSTVPTPIVHQKYFHIQN